MARILESSNENIGRASLLYCCNLSSSQFDLYKEFLVETGLLNVSREHGVENFRATEKGNNFLRDYAKIKGLMDKVKQPKGR